MNKFVASLAGMFVFAFPSVIYAASAVEATNFIIEEIIVTATKT